VKDIRRAWLRSLMNSFAIRLWAFNFFFYIQKNDYWLSFASISAGEQVLPHWILRASLHLPD